MTGRPLRRIVAGFLIALLPAAIRAGVPEVAGDTGHEEPASGHEEKDEDEGVSRVPS